MEEIGSGEYDVKSKLKKIEYMTLDIAMLLC